MGKLMILLLVTTTMAGNLLASESVFESGKSSQQIADEILNGAKQRYQTQLQQKQQAEKDKIVMYATSWCGYCKKARTYFKDKRIEYTEYDIEDNYGAKLKYDSLGGKGVPLIVMGDNIMRGFSVKNFEKYYALMK